MTDINCWMGECRSWLNNKCSRRNVKVVGTRCLDFTRRKSQFRNVTTTITCDQHGCMANRNGTCSRERITMRGDGCDCQSLISTS